MSTSILGWKTIPKSPLAHAEDDVWFFSDDEEKKNDLVNGSLCSLTKSEIARQLLEDIDSLVKQEDSDTFSNWFEQKVDLPIFDEIQPVLPSEEFKPGSEELKDLEYALNKSDLTPPHSPENSENGSFFTLDFNSPNAVQFSNENVAGYTTQSIRGFVLSPDDYVVVSDNYIQDSSSTPIYGGENGFQPHSDTLTKPIADGNFLTAPPTPTPDLEREMAVVDEVVRSTAQGLETHLDLWESENSNSQSSSPGSVTSYDSPRRVGVEDESDDSEWLPFMEKTAGKAAKSRKRSKPYGRECSQTDRWLRKKEQNKNAATRYRQKKKAEVSEILEEEKMLEDRKWKLEQRVSDIRMEIKCLKGLMRDLFKAKGLLIN